MPRPSCPARPGPRRRARKLTVGPLFFYELVRLARRGRSTLLRCTYGGVLFAGLYLIYSAHYGSPSLLTDPFAPGPSIPPAQRARFVQMFVTVVLYLQCTAVLAMAPAR